MATFLGNKNFTHGQASTIGVLLVNLGSPSAPTPAAVRRFLAEFLSDTRMIEIPMLLWKPILHGIILRVRPKQSAEGYKQVWTENGSPLTSLSHSVAKKCEAELAKRYPNTCLYVRSAMRYGDPSLKDALLDFQQKNVRQLLIVPMFPQYSAVTAASVFDKISETLTRCRWLPDLYFLQHYASHPQYINAISQSISDYWQQHGRSEKLLLSFHGLPERNLKLGDPYYCYCHKTARLVKESLSLSDEEAKLVFQSRFGKAKWLQPYCEQTLVELAQQGVKTIDVVCPGFAVECLETLEEIAIRYQETFIEAGGERLRYIPALNDSSAQIDLYTSLIEQNIGHWLAAPANTPETAPKQVAEKCFNT
jgi:ferrochelatase